MTSLGLRVLSRLGQTFRHTPLAKSLVLNRLHGALSLRCHGSCEAIVGPFRVRFDPRDRFIAKNLVLYGGYEAYGIALLCSLVQPGDVVLDVGANIGLYSLYLSRAVGAAGQVVAVEPDPGNVELLRHNLAANGCENVTVLPCAFGDESKLVELFQAIANRGNSSLVDLEGTGRSIQVPLRRGDDVLADLGLHPRVAKVDVEGAEPDVLAGFGERKPAILLMEFIPSLLRKMQHDPRALLESLVHSGYTLEWLDAERGTRRFGTPASIVSLAEGYQGNSNILARREVGPGRTE